MGICQNCFNCEDLSEIKISDTFQEKELNANLKGNYIFAEIEIKDDDVNRDIRIIDSYEEYHNNWDFKEFNEDKSNEEEIKQCKLIIDGQSVPFNYLYNFKNIGKHTIIYTFQNNLTRTNFMFYKCEKLTKLDFSHFHSENVTTMEAMFSECVSLTDINFSNFNTQNVTNMNHTFYECQSLTNLDLSSFDTRNVTNMYSLFEGCKSLAQLNLSTFNTEKMDPLNMEDMFEGCGVLIEQNIITNDGKIKEIISQKK